VYQNQEQYKKADECLRKAISIKPTNADALNKLGLNFDNLAIYDSAYLYYNKAVLADSSYYHSIYNMARIDRIQNNYKKAEVKLWKALSLQPNYADAYNLLGLCAEDQKKLDSSIYYYTSAIKSDSSMYYSWYNLGRVYQNQDDYKKAEPYLKQAVAIKKSQDALNILALNFENLNHLDSAYYYYIQAKEADSNYFYPWYNLGRLYQNDKKYSQAEMHLKKAISIKPQSAEALNTLGLNFENLQLMDSAIIYYQKSIKADSNYYYPWYNISLLYQDNGDYNTAIAFLKKAISLRPTSTGAYNALANAFDDMGQKDSAIKYYQKALSIDSNYIYAVYNLGRVYRNTQQLALAEKFCV
jgi:superkiller protein 3